MEWVFQMGGNGSGNLANIEPKFHISPIDSSIYITGAFYGTTGLNFGGTQIAHDPLLSGENGVFIAKLSRSGDPDWVKSFKGGGANFFHDLAFDDQGSVYVGGQTGDPITMEGTFIDYGGESGYVLLKYDDQGVFQWLEHGQNGNVQELEWTPAGLVSAMVFENNVVVGGSSFTATPSNQIPAQDILISVFNSDGQLTSSQQIGGDGNIDARALVCNDTMCVLQGKFANILTLDGMDYTTSGASVHKAYQYAFMIQQFIFKWINISSEPFSILMDGLNIGSDGRFYSKAIYENVFEMQGFWTESQGNRDILVLTQDINSGRIIEGRSFGELESDAILHVLENSDRVVVSGTFRSVHVEFNGIAVDNANEVGMPYVVIMDTMFKGQCRLELDADNQSKVFQSELIGDTLYSLLSVTTSTHIEDISLSALGGFDLALVKTLLPCSRMTAVPTSEPPPNQFSLTPNPFTTHAQLTYKSPQGTRPTLQLTDMLGRVVQTVQLPSNEGTYTLKAVGLGTGVYFCSLLSGTEVLATEKLMIEQ